MQLRRRRRRNKANQKWYVADLRPSHRPDTATIRPYVSAACVNCLAIVAATVLPMKSVRPAIKPRRAMDVQQQQQQQQQWQRFGFTVAERQLVVVH